MTGKKRIAILDSKGGHRVFLWPAGHPQDQAAEASLESVDDADMHFEEPSDETVELQRPLKGRRPDVPPVDKGRVMQVPGYFLMRA